MIVSGDLVMEENMRGMVDMHRMNSSSFTALLSKPMFDVKTAVVPGAKTTKHKKGIRRIQNTAFSVIIS